MKTMNLTQKLNPAFLGDSTPNHDRHLYQVTKIVNAVSPEIRTNLTKKQVSKYCHSDDWNVVIS